MDTYAEAISWIHSQLKHGINLGLARMEWLLDKMGNPEKELKVIHVAGTNGKGSTVTFLRSILNEAGYQVGTFTSPYIEQFNERISVNGQPVCDEEIVALVKVVRPLVEQLQESELGPPTEFEIITAMAILYFAKVRPVDFTILEVGLGGRFDSTNTVHPIASLITNIGLDHMNILGDSIDQIAYEKAGIIKKGVPVFTGAKQDAAKAVIQEEAKKHDAELFEIGADFFVKDHQSVKQGERFTFQSKTAGYDQLEVSLLGRHQTENAALAVATLLYLTDKGHMTLTEKEVRAGLKQAYWPARMELLCENPTIILDGAHNPEGLRAFSATMKERYRDQKIKLVFAALEDKDLSQMLQILEQLNADIYLTEFDFPRAASAARLKETGQMEQAIVDDDWQTLISSVVKALEPDDILAVTGSLYFLSMVKPKINDLISE